MTRLLSLSLLFLLFLAGCGDSEPEPFAGYERTPTPVVGDQSLPAVEASGQEETFDFRAQAGPLLLVYFGYTSCPDVCPTTLSDVRAAFDEIGDDAEAIELVMVTIDPEVDTPDVLVPYVRSFVPRVDAVWTLDDDRLRQTATAFGADYGKLENDDGELDVFHTGSLYAVDREGQLVLTWPFGTAIDDLRSDLDRLLEELA